MTSDELSLKDCFILGALIYHGKSGFPSVATDDLQLWFCVVLEFSGVEEPLTAKLIGWAVMQAHDNEDNNDGDQYANAT